MDIGELKNRLDHLTKKSEDLDIDFDIEIIKAFSGDYLEGALSLKDNNIGVDLSVIVGGKTETIVLERLMRSAAIRLAEEFEIDKLRRDNNDEKGIYENIFSQRSYGWLQEALELFNEYLKKYSYEI